MDQLTQSLVGAGLNNKEAKVYIALLQLGRASAYSVSEKSGLKKPTTYVVLDELMKKGLVLKIPRVKKQHYIAKPPEEFFAMAEERLNTAKKALPQLLRMTENNKTEVRTLFYEGLRGIEEAMYYHKEEMKGREIVGFYATAEDASPELMNIFNSWPKKITGCGIKLKVITPAHDTTKEVVEVSKILGCEIKTIPYEQYSSKASIEAGDDFVRIVLFKPLQAIIVDSPELAQSLRQIFEMMWCKY
jgi:predicted transcriptional regulator